MKIRKATAEERLQYRGQCYPLYGVIDDFGAGLLFKGYRICVEDLRGSGEPDDPKFEALAPDKHHFTDGADVLHSILGVSLQDLKERLAFYRVVPCNEKCGV